MIRHAAGGPGAAGPLPRQREAGASSPAEPGAARLLPGSETIAGAPTAPADLTSSASARGPSAPGLGRTIARNAAFTVAGRMFFLLGWALITPYMLRVLGVDRFAIWALFFALSG